MQNPIVSDGTPQYEECNMDYSDDEDDPRHHTEVEEYIAGTIRTILQPDLRIKGPQTRFRKRVDEATYHWTPITVSDLDEIDKTPKKPEGRSARGRRSTKRPYTDQPELAGGTVATQDIGLDAEATDRLCRCRRLQCHCTGKYLRLA
jgi:hypothetical protein